MSTLPLYYGYWDYWQLNHKVTFDGVNKLILINPGVTSLNVQTDIYSAWKEWLLGHDGLTNARYEKALNVIGGEPTVGSEKLDATYFLINGWKIKPYPGSYTLTIAGNIFDVNGGDIKVPADVNTFDPNNITINLNTSVIVRRIETEVTGSITSIDGIVTASLVSDERTALFEIRDAVYGSVIITASLEPTQAEILSDIQLKMNELWKIHGLDSSAPLNVSPTLRIAGNVSQSISQVGDTVTITR